MEGGSSRPGFVCRGCRQPGLTAARLLRGWKVSEESGTRFSRCEKMKKKNKHKNMERVFLTKPAVLGSARAVPAHWGPFPEAPA